MIVCLIEREIMRVRLSATNHDIVFFQTSLILDVFWQKAFDIDIFQQKVDISGEPDSRDFLF